MINFSQKKNNKNSFSTPVQAQIFHILAMRNNLLQLQKKEHWQ
jgi:hypothetical protein